MITCDGNSPSNNHGVMMFSTTESSDVFHDVNAYVNASGPTHLHGWAYVQPSALGTFIDTLGCIPSGNSFRQAPGADPTTVTCDDPYNTPLFPLSDGTFTSNSHNAQDPIQGYYCMKQLNKEGVDLFYLGVSWAGGSSSNPPCTLATNYFTNPSCPNGQECTEPDCVTPFPGL
jgi:hypothetical protein